MTTTATTETTTPNMSWSEIAVRIANHMASEGFGRGDLAALRRMNPESPNAAAFWRLTARYDVLRGEESERRWGLILHGIALMTKTGGRAPFSVLAVGDKRQLHHIPGAYHPSGEPFHVLDDRSRLERSFGASGNPAVVAGGGARCVF